MCSSDRSRQSKGLCHSVCGTWSECDRWRLSLLQRPQARLPRRHCSHGLFWWAGAPKGGRVTTHLSSSHASARSNSLLCFLPNCKIHTSNPINILSCVHKRSSAFTRINREFLLFPDALAHFLSHLTIVLLLPVRREAADTWRQQHGVENWLGMGGLAGGGVTGRIHGHSRKRVARWHLKNNVV